MGEMSGQIVEVVGKVDHCARTHTMLLVHHDAKISSPGFTARRFTQTVPAHNETQGMSGRGIGLPGWSSVSVNLSLSATTPAGTGHRAPWQQLGAHRPEPNPAGNGHQRWQDLIPADQDAAVCMCDCRTKH